MFDAIAPATRNDTVSATVASLAGLEPSTSHWPETVGLVEERPGNLVRTGGLRHLI